MAKKPSKAPKVARVEDDEDDEVAQRRKAIAAEAAARGAERKAAWKEHAEKNKDTEERRKASEPDKAFAEAARKAKARAEQERIDLHAKSYEAEAKRRNPDEKAEKRFRDKHEDVLHRHMAAWANIQEISQGAVLEETREALQVMARCWKEKEDILLSFPKKKKADDSVLEARTESLKGKLVEMEETRKKVTPKPPKKKRPPRRPKKDE